MPEVSRGLFSGPLDGTGNLSIPAIQTARELVSPVVTNRARTRLGPKCLPDREENSMHGIRFELVTLLILAAAFAPARAETLWREGETANTSTFKRHPWWYDKVKKDKLMGEAWLSHYDRKEEGLATYNLELQTGGKYTLWLRANPSRSVMSYKIDQGQWKKIDFTQTLEKINIAEDGKEDVRYLAWVKVGPLELKAGKFTLSFKAHSPLYNHGAIDIFVLTNERFDPKTAEKPEMDAYGNVIERIWRKSPAEKAREEPKTISAAATWSFEAPEDPSAEPMLNLRYLNEEQAGQGGWIRRSEDGRDFVNKDGQSVRFWAVNSSLLDASPEQMDKQAAFLAGKGVNMVRVTPSIHPKGADAAMTDVDEEELEKVFRFVAACRNQGIYVTICPYWAHGSHLADAAQHWGIEGYDTDQVALFGLIFFHEPLQEAYKAWVRELYTRKNPHTGLALKDDPAVAIAQVLHDDSLLFFTFQAIREPVRGELRKLFADWAKEKYGSLDKASQAWDAAEHFNDNYDQGQVGLYQTWQFTQTPGPDNPTGQAKRMADQMEFMARLQHDFYSGMKKYYKDELGCKQLILAADSKTANPLLMDDAERWSQTGADIIGVSRFVEGYHMGPQRDVQIQAEQQFGNLSVLKKPDALPAALKQVAGHPMVVTESTWLHPNRYQSEGAMLVSAYMSMGGVDSLYWSLADSTDWVYNPIGDDGAMNKLSLAVPQLLGSFPANALAFRKGYVSRAEAPAVSEHRSLEAVFNRKVPIFSDIAEADELRTGEQYAANSPIRKDVHRAAGLVGPVEVTFGSEEGKTKLNNVDTLIDSEAKTVASSTGELELNWDKGICTVDAPKYQAISGFLRVAGGTFKTSALRVDSLNDYVTIVAVSMDDQPIRSSSKVLVQITTAARPQGWTTKVDDVVLDGKTVPVETILKLGQAPLQVLETKTSITIGNPGLSKAGILDHTGRFVEEAAVLPAADGGVKVALTNKTMYVILE